MVRCFPGPWPGLDFFCLSDGLRPPFGFTAAAGELDCVELISGTPSSTSRRARHVAAVSEAELDTWQRSVELNWTEAGAPELPLASHSHSVGADHWLLTKRVRLP